MANYCTPLVEYSTDPLSVTTPTWIDVTRFVQDVSWYAGTATDLDDPQNGGCVIVLKNGDRRFEPDNPASPYYPNVKPLRRFRITITADGNTVRQGIFYVQSWDITWPAKTSYSTATATCTDGFTILSLYTLPRLTPATATTYSDVVEADSPFAHWPLDETIGRTMNAATGPQGVYRKDVAHVPSSPVIGEAGYGTQFGYDGFAKAVLDDSGVFHDSGAVTAEVVINKAGTPASPRILIAGPFDTPNSAYSFTLYLQSDGTLNASIFQNSGTSVTVTSPGTVSNGNHHCAVTFDGGFATLYLDGVQVAQRQGVDNIVNPDANEAIYLGNEGGPVTTTETTPIVMGHAALYTYALTTAQIQNHATAALSRGYTTETTGSRIANLATHPLWSTSAIGTGSYTVAPRMQVGQTKLDEILETVKAEQPFGLFWFDGQGRPAYRGADADTTVQAVFGDTGGDIRYSDITLAYDDQLFNTVTASRDGGTGQTRTDSASVTAYGVRGYSADNLILSNDGDVALVAAGIQEHFSQPQFRVITITLNGATQAARAQILNRDIGDTIRVRRLGDTAQPIDIITRILAKEKSLDVHGDLRCTWTLARGFPAAAQVWRIGQAGYSEIGVTTILG